MQVVDRRTSAKGIYARELQETISQFFFRFDNEFSCDRVKSTSGFVYQLSSGHRGSTIFARASHEWRCIMKDYSRRGVYGSDLSSDVIKLTFTWDALSTDV